MREVRREGRGHRSPHASHMLDSSVSRCLPSLTLSFPRYPSHPSPAGSRRRREGDGMGRVTRGSGRALRFTSLLPSHRLRPPDSSPLIVGPLPAPFHPTSPPSVPAGRGDKVKRRVSRGGLLARRNLALGSSYPHHFSLRSSRDMSLGCSGPTSVSMSPVSRSVRRSFPRFGRSFPPYLLLTERSEVARDEPRTERT